MNSRQPETVSFDLPLWIEAYIEGYQQTLDIHQRMQFVIAAANKNIVEATGGPFAAAIFTAATGELVALGVNLVVEQGLSMLHAEMVAISLAERKLGQFNLVQHNEAYELYSSAEPCAMCLGAIEWAGVNKLVCAATDSDVRAIGFDEGLKPDGWQEKFIESGIEVVTAIENDASNAVLQAYKKSGLIYNAKKPR